MLQVVQITIGCYKCTSVSDFKKHLSPDDKLCEVCFIKANDTPREPLA